MDSLQTLLSARSLAERWDCGRSTIYEMVANKELPSIKIRGMLRIPLGAVVEKESCLARLVDTGSNPEKDPVSTKSAGLRIVARGHTCTHTSGNRAPHFEHRTRRRSSARSNSAPT